MNKQLKRDLQRFYQAPEPVHKRIFLQQFDDGTITVFEFVRMQAAYIHKWNWLLAGAVFLLALVGSRMADRSMVWCLSAAIPFLALMTVTEINQSVRWGMSELELSARFSLKFVTLARLLILGIGNFILLMVLIPVICIWQQTAIIDSAIHILIAYLLPTFFNLIIVRKIHGRESLYACMGVTVLISAGYMIMGYLPVRAAELVSMEMWLGIFGLLVILTGRELTKVVKQTEEYVWS